ncbi:YopX family protein [Bacillus spizizenii]|nr:YopX family protein [Bacillus spizizenii]
MNTAYRVWDGEQMHYWDDPGMSLEIIGTHWFLRNMDNKGHKKYVTGSHEEGTALMWGTGLKDKNGKDIYQKDITEESYVSPMTKRNVIERYVIESEKGIDKMKHVSNISALDRFLRYRLDEIEVVGDVFENPELLEGVE